MNEAKVILYPIAGVFQFVLAAQNPHMAPFFIPIGLALIGLSVLKLMKLTRK